MGTMLQTFNLTEIDFKNKKFLNHHKDLKGNNDILCLTQPEIIKKIHTMYLTSGADIIETNTFNANAISQKDYDTQNYVYDINFSAAQIAKKAANIFTDKPRFVAGAIGPTNQTASISPDISFFAKSICVISPVIIALEVTPNLVKNIFICIFVEFCASSKIMNAL